MSCEMNKYELTGETKTLDNGAVLRRIRAVRDFKLADGTTFPAGALGGWVENEGNLSQTGNAWVFGNARVYDAAHVSGNAIVYGRAEVYDDARVYDIDFVRKSERGTMVDFLRYYEDEIPQDVIDKKIAADRLMVFDNYVVAYYSDLIHKAASTQKKVSTTEEQKVRERRRDPILFGVIKNSRKLYYICDWTTDTDDLTLEKLEKELGITRGSLVSGAATNGDLGDEENSSVGRTLDDDRIVRLVRNEIGQTLTGDDYYSYNAPSGYRWSFINANA